MENKLALPATPLPELAPAARPAPVLPETSAIPPAAPEPDLRLVIEERAGTYVYKTIDRRTGEVVQQLPREEVVRMRDDEAYAAGAVVSTEA